MLYKYISNTNPYPYLKGQLVKLDCNLLKSIPTTYSQSICNFECCYIENVFALVGGENYQNDKSSFLFSKLITSDTIVIELIKPDGTTATITDNTYGAYYSTFSANPLYIGFVLDFEKCLQLIGIGTYQIKVTKTILGISYTWYSQYFYLKQYDEMAINKTVRLEWYQTGNILSNELNYEDLISNGWYQSIRFKGILSNKIPKIITDNYLNEKYQIKQIQNKIYNEYTLETNLLPINISDKLIYDGILANKLLISNYNLFAEEFVVQRELICDEIVEKKSTYKNKNSIFVIKFKEKDENIIKTNF